MVYNRCNISWQYFWRGNHLTRIPILVGPDEYDKPNEQARARILSPDPLPIQNPRPEDFVSEMYGGVQVPSPVPPIPPAPAYVATDDSGANLLTTDGGSIILDD